MKGLLLIGLFFAPVLAAIGVFWLMAANDAAPDPSALSREVEVIVLDYRREERASSSYRHAYRVDGTTYVDDEFVPLRYGPPSERPLKACVAPGSPADHGLLLYPDDPPCGRIGAEPQPATPVMWEGSTPPGNLPAEGG